MFERNASFVKSFNEALYSFSLLQDVFPTQTRGDSSIHYNVGVEKDKRGYVIFRKVLLGQCLIFDIINSYCNVFIGNS